MKSKIENIILCVMAALGTILLIAYQINSAQ